MSLGRLARMCWKGLLHLPCGQNRDDGGSSSLRNVRTRLLIYTALHLNLSTDLSTPNLRSTNTRKNVPVCAATGSNVMLVFRAFLSLILNVLQSSTDGFVKESPIIRTSCKVPPQQVRIKSYGAHLLHFCRNILTNGAERTAP